MKLAFLLIIATALFLDYCEASPPRGLSFGGKPILRLGNPIDADVDDDDDPEHRELLKEPKWVSNLRSTIIQQIETLGVEKAAPHIKQLISDVADGVKDLKSNEEPEGKKGLRALAQAAEQRIDTNIEPAWVSDLKSYIKHLIANKGRAGLDGYVNPVIESIEKNKHVTIKDIDVNPYGEVFVNYEKAL